jgi:hypothetical protein
MLNAPGCLPAGNAPNLPLKTGNPGGLPGRANATIRSPAAASIASPRSGFGTARHRKLKALICRVYLFVRNGNAATGSVVVVRLRLSLPSSIG